jgi:hypothetical protein
MKIMEEVREVWEGIFHLVFFFSECPPSYPDSSLFPPLPPLPPLDLVLKKKGKKMDDLKTSGGWGEVGEVGEVGKSFPWNFPFVPSSVLFLENSSFFSLQQLLKVT